LFRSRPGRRRSVGFATTTYAVRPRAGRDHVRADAALRDVATLSADDRRHRFPQRLRFGRSVPILSISDR
jgi:hypothetical protein